MTGDVFLRGSLFPLVEIRFCSLRGIVGAADGQVVLLAELRDVRIPEKNLGFCQVSLAHMGAVRSLFQAAACGFADAVFTIVLPAHEVNLVGSPHHRGQKWRGLAVATRCWTSKAAL